MWSDSDAAALEKRLSLATKTSVTERQSKASGRVTGSLRRMTVCPGENKNEGKTKQNIGIDNWQGGGRKIGSVLF